MIKKLLPVLLALVGLGGGLGAGIMLRPAAEEKGEPVEEHGAEPSESAEEHSEPDTAEEEDHGAAEAGGEKKADYIQMSNQFVVPIVKDGRVASMVVLKLNLEGIPGSTDLIYAKEPKLRDAFLQLLFDHANSGGFEGAFTEGTKMTTLRRALLEQARKIMPDHITDVLISDIARQDN